MVKIWACFTGGGISHVIAYYTNASRGLSATAELLLSFLWIDRHRNRQTDRKSENITVGNLGRERKRERERERIYLPR